MAILLGEDLEFLIEFEEASSLEKLEPFVTARRAIFNIRRKSELTMHERTMLARALSRLRDRTFELIRHSPDQHLRVRVDHIDRILRAIV